DRAVHSSFGTIAPTWYSIFTGSRVATSPSRLVSRITWVSTAKPGESKPAPRITFAVLRPIPGLLTMSSIVVGTSPPKSSTRARLAARIRIVFNRKNPVGLISFSTSEGSAAARSCAVGYRRKSSGVTRFTERSVVCAERIVAISSWNGFSYFSSVSAWYRSRKRSAVSSARFFAPRGGRGVIHDGLRLEVGFGLGAKQPARYSRDLISVR